LRRAVFIGYANYATPFSPVWRGQVQAGGGVIWTECSGAFPATSFPRSACYGLLVDPDNPRRLWASAADSVFVTEDGGAWWRPFSEGLAHGVNITGLSFRNLSRTLYLSTWGRGLFARQVS